MKRAFVIGSAVLDVLVKSSGLKVMKSHQVKGGLALAEIYGGKSEAEDLVLETGGAGTNVAVGLSKLGTTTALISRVGSDLVKERVFDQMNIYGIETSMIQVSQKGRSGTSVVLIAPDGGRSILTFRGESGRIEKEKIDWEKVARSDWVHVAALGGEMNLAEDIIEFCSKEGIKVSWNPGKKEIEMKERLKTLLPKVETLILNRMEASILLGHDYEKLKEMNKRLLDYGVAISIITDGKRGVGVGSKEGFLKMTAFKTKSTDDTGAGDAFCSAYVASRLMDDPLVDCVKAGLANGASVVKEIGAKAGLLDKRGMKKWMEKKLEILQENF